MDRDQYIAALIQYGIEKQLISVCDSAVAVNRILEILQLDSYTPPLSTRSLPLELILKGLLDDAQQRGVCGERTVHRDLLDTRLMGALTPMPREVQKQFWERYHTLDPKAATDWYYQFSQDTDYIRRYRIQKDMRWKVATEYGKLDITINLSKPEKDPKAIAAAKAAPQSGYPQCQLCAENEGYAGRLNHPARQNHRIIPLKIDDADWCLQYSPYVYYNEHCIVFNKKHLPMVIDRSVFRKLLDFTELFPHYFIGSNADLPIVGGSILSHEHFQGGRYTFPMETAPIEKPIAFAGYPDVQAGIVKWPMSVIRITGPDKNHLVALADKILQCWRGYSDPSAFLFSETEGVPHHTITPIARRRGTDYELDLVLRSNLTTDRHPLGVYHPHAELHHIKKENIGLIEVMGLAVLPARLKQELMGIEQSLLENKPLDGELTKHAAWVAQLKEKYTFTPENTACILKVEVGKVFAKVLEQAGVFKRDLQGVLAFNRFIEYINKEAERWKS